MADDGSLELLTGLASGFANATADWLTFTTQFNGWLAGDATQSAMPLVNSLGGTVYVASPAYLTANALGAIAAVEAAATLAATNTNSAANSAIQAVTNNANTVLANVSTVMASKLDTASPAFTGTLSGPTANVTNLTVTNRPSWAGATPWDSGNLTISDYLTTANAASIYATNASVQAQLSTLSNTTTSILTSYAKLGTSATMTGVTVANTGVGSVSMNLGDATHTGQVEFFNAAGARAGYIGWAVANSAIQMETEDGYTGYNFSSRPTFNGYTPWDSNNFNPALYAPLASPALTGNATVNGAPIYTSASFSTANILSGLGAANGTPHSVMAFGADPTGTSGNMWCVDSAVGDGLGNITFGAWENQLHNASGTGYYYGGTRGASRIAFQDNVLAFYVGTLGSGGGQQYGNAVTWVEPLWLSSTAMTVGVPATFASRPTFNGYTPWDGQNLANPAQTTGATFSGAVTMGSTLQVNSTANFSNYSSFTMVGTPVIANTSPGAYGGLRINQNNTSAGASYIEFLNNNRFGAYFGLDTSNQFCVGGWSFGANSYPLLHTANYGALVSSVQNLTVTSGNITAPGYNTNGDWVRIYGSEGVYWQTYGVGWYAQDSTWLRAYNGASIYTTGTVECGAFTVTSDAELKTDIEPLQGHGDIIDRTRACRFVKDERVQFGVIAQYEQENVPDLVREGGRILSSGRRALTVEMIGYVPILLAEVKDLRARLREAGL